MNHSRRLGGPLPQRVAVLRALQLGDLLCAVPALRALRSALPEAEIVLIGLPWAKTFVERFDHYLDGFLEFPGYPGLPERPPQLGQVPAFFAAAQRARFDLALQMHGSGGITNPLTVLLGARCNAGFFVPGQYCPDERRFLPYPDHEHEVRRHLRLMEFLGVPLQGERMDFPLGEDDDLALRAIAGARDLPPGEYVCLHPGARDPSRRWPPQRFAVVADALAARGLRVVLTGSADEAKLTQAVAGVMANPALDLAGRTGLGALAALIAGARLLVCNDTGVSHLAAALRVPSVVIYTASDPDRWAPLDCERHRPVRCAAGVTPAAVLARADDLLDLESLLSARPAR